MESYGGSTCRDFRDKLGLVEFAERTQRALRYDGLYPLTLLLGVWILGLGFSILRKMRQTKRPTKPQPEYREGREAFENPERVMKGLFRAPKLHSKKGKD